MQEFKVHFTLAISLSFLIGCSTSYNEHPDYSLTIKQTGSHKLNWGAVHDLKFQLVPKRDSLAGLFLMTCSWSDHSTTSDSNLIVAPLACDANFMTHGVIPSGKFLELYSPIWHINGEEIIGQKVRVALIIIDSLDMTWTEYMGWDPDYEKHFIDSLKKQEHRYVWSNEIEIKDMKNSDFRKAGWKLQPIDSSTNH